MIVAVLLVTESDVTQLISWGAYFARASETDLLVLQVQLPQIMLLLAMRLLVLQLQLVILLLMHKGVIQILYLREQMVLLI